MRRLRLYIIIFLAIVWFSLLLPYFIVQTSFGAKLVGQQLSTLGQYNIAIGSIRHSVSKLYELTLEDVIVRDDKHEIVNIPKLIIGLDKDNFWQLKHFNYITIIDGVINDAKIKPSDISANTLKFVNSTVNTAFSDEQEPIVLQGLNGGIKPFVSSGENYKFDLTAQKILFNQFTISSVLIQGFQRDGIVSVTNLGGNVNNGFFLSKLNILPDESLDIEQLKINHINFQSALELQDLNKFLDRLPNLTIRQLSLFDSSAQLPFFSIEKGNLEATNFSYNKRWHFNQGSLVFNADNIVWYDELFLSPLIQLQANEQCVTIEKALATWNKGNVNFTGSWQDNQLRLNQLTIAGMRYELPEHFYEDILPEVFSQVTIDKLMILPSLLIETNQEYPFVLTHFEVSGSNVTVAQQRKLGLYSGSLLFKSETGSLNSVNFKYSDLMMTRNSDNNWTLNFSALMPDGMIESIATMNPAQNEFLSLRINGYNVATAILEKWKLVKNPPNSANFITDLHGPVSPFSLAGTLSAGGSQFTITPQN